VPEKRERADGAGEIPAGRAGDPAGRREIQQPGCKPGGIRFAVFFDMRISHPLIPTTLLVLMMLVGRPMAADAQVGIFRLQALNDSGVREGTCFVIRQETRADGTYLVLVTSARLFDRESGRRALLHVAGQPPVEIVGDAITTPYDNQRDIAVLKAKIEPTQVATLPVTFERVPAGSAFVIAGVRADGSAALADQHVRYCATRAVLGDRSTADLVGCQGAPAIAAQQVFGVVSECQPDRVPEITPLAVSRSFLLRAVPGLSDEANGASTFGVGHQDEYSAHGRTYENAVQGARPRGGKSSRDSAGYRPRATR
jgi:hypothetical protein